MSFPKTEKRNHQRDVSQLKYNKTPLHNKRYKENIEKGEKWQMKSIRNFKSIARTIRSFTFTFGILIRMHSAPRHSLGKCSFYYCISSNFLSFAGYIKRSNKILTSI